MNQFIVLAALVASFASAAANAVPIYVPNGNGVSGDDGAVAIFDTDTQAIRQRVPVAGVEPATAVAARNGERFYVLSHRGRANPSSGLLEAYTAGTGERIGTIETAINNELLAVSPRSDRVYANAASGQGLIVVNADPLAVVGEIDTGGLVETMAISGDGAEIFAVRSSNLLVIDTRTNQVTRTKVLPPLAFDVALSPDGLRLFVTHVTSPGLVTVIDAATLITIGSVPVAPSPLRVAVSSDGGEAYISHGAGRLITVVNADTLAIRTTLPTPVGAYALDFHPNGRALFALGTADAVLMELDLTGQAEPKLSGGFGRVAGTGHFVGPDATAAVEFYNKALDHYFLTADAAEAKSLDKGVHPGWVRTQQTFGVWTKASGASAVCRFYGAPAHGLDSHFYSASVAECREVEQKYTGVWLKETDEAFYVEPADPSTGGCGAPLIPVYRLWNNRTDSNHRYTTSKATRDRMILRGYVPEGAGVGVVFCGR